MGKEISKTTFVSMVVVAAIFDLLQLLFNLLHLIPVVGNIIALIVTTVLSIVAWLTFYLWMRMKGINFSSPQRLLGFGGGFLIELIPILNALPAWTFAVIYTVLSMKAEKIFEEKTGIHVGLPSSSPVKIKR